eukprot:7495496-Alexandrium_andersonii.AAC.1
MYPRNKLSAKETVALVRRASRAGAAGVTDLAQAGGKDVGLKNAQRDLMRRLLKGTKMPPIYFAT